MPIYLRQDGATQAAATLAQIDPHQTRIADIKTGTAHISSEVQHWFLADLRGTPGITLHEPKASSAYAVILLKHAPPLDNKKVRQALAMLVDREALNSEVFYGVGTIAQGCKGWSSSGRS